MCIRDSSHTFQRGLEQLPLLRGRDVRNNYDQSRVYGFATVKGHKVGAVIRDERVLPLPNEGHELPILVSA